MNLISLTTVFLLALFLNSHRYGMNHLLTEMVRDAVSVMRTFGCVTRRCSCYQIPNRKEWRSDPKALDAIKAEASGLLAEKTWLEETVIEKADLLQWANHSRKKIHIGDLLLLCSIKYFEMPEAYHKHKGRICFRGDNARDEKGACAVYQELSASPTSIHTANCNIAYGCLPGHKTTQALSLIHI